MPHVRLRPAQISPSPISHATSNLPLCDPHCPSIPFPPAVIQRAPSLSSPSRHHHSPRRFRTRARRARANCSRARCASHVICVRRRPSHYLSVPLYSSPITFRASMRTQRIERSCCAESSPTPIPKQPSPTARVNMLITIELPPFPFPSIYHLPSHSPSS